MDQQPSPPSTGPAALVQQARALLAALTETLWSARTPEELVGLVQQLEMLRAQIAGVEASAITEVQARGIAKDQLAWSSTGDWFTHTAGTHRRAGHRTTR